MARRIYFVSPTNVADHRRGGASICSLAYLQAVAACAPSGVTLLSPLCRQEMPELPDQVDEVVTIPQRAVVTKAVHLLTARSMDRLSPFVDRFVESRDLRQSLFFMNGSRGGGITRWLRDRGVPSITLFHNVEERFVAASVRNPLMRQLMRRAAARSDRLSFECSIASIFLSGVDARLMHARAAQAIHGAQVVDGGYFAPEELPGESGPLSAPTAHDLVISCHLGVAQNVPGILPALAAARLVIAGASPVPAIAEAVRGVERLDLVANPDDASLRSILARAVASVSTIESGSGIKVRVAESLRTGRPVIGTAHSLIGYERIDRNVLLEADFEGMPGAIADVMGDPRPEARCDLARREYEEKLSFAAGAARVARLIGPIL
jgi:hypothetical protein